MWTPSKPVQPGTPPLLSVRRVTVTYCSGEESVTAVREASFDLAAGEIVGVLGESGSGKSTLALSILGLLPAHAAVEGSIQFQNSDLLKNDESSWQSIRGAKISMISQEPALALNPVMRVGDQLAEVIRAHRPGSRRLRQQECEAILSQMCLSDVERIYRAYPHQLSGGQLHRVVIAQAVACQPDLVIADEPTRSLDLTVQTEILEVLRAASRQFGSAVLFITHNPALLSAFADRVIVMYAGGIAEDGPVTQVFRRPLHPYTRALLDLVPRDGPPHVYAGTARLPTIPGSSTDVDHSTQGCVFEPRCPAKTRVCQSESPDQKTLPQGRRVSCFNHGN